jgi:hypothetical protein
MCQNPFSYPLLYIYNLHFQFIVPLGQCQTQNIESRP